MMPQNTQDDFYPDAEIIKKHLDFIIEGSKPYEDGRIEVGGLFGSNTANYALDTISNAVSVAAALNNPGQNVYLVGALIDPDSMPLGRCADKDFYATTVVWADIDDPHDSEALKALYAHCPPSRAIVTAKIPTRRVQLWWKLDEPLQDSDTLREALVGIAQALGGDTKVTNPTSLMRLAGTINYPNEKKQAKGRVVEKTAYVEIHNKKYSIENILTAFPVKDYIAAAETHTAQDYIYDNSQNPFGKLKIKDGRETYMHRMVYAAIINLTGELKAWPTPEQVLDNVWPVYIRNVGEQGGRTLDQDNRGRKAILQKAQSKLRSFKAGGMKRYGFATIDDVIAQSKTKYEDQKEKEDFDPQTGEIKLPPFKAIDIADIDLNNIPPRAWLFGDIVARKYVTMIAASPGAGKSVFTMQAAICAVAGKPFGPHMPHEPQINAWVYNNEEGEEELRRRVAAMLIHEEIDKKDISGRFFMNSGESHSICIARKNIEGGVIHTPDYEQLKAQILANKIDLLIVDPFAETHDLNENSNDEIKTVAGMYRRLAIECNCAVLLVHHTRKGSNSGDKSSENNSNADSARGGGAQIGVVRRMFTLAKMDSNAAASLNVSDEHRYWYVRFDDAKTNITAPTQSTQWFKFKSIALGNQTGLYTKGDSVGVLCHKTKEEIMEQEGDSLKEERLALLNKIAFIMIHSGRFEMTAPDLLDALIANGYTRYKVTALRKFIKETILYKMPIQQIICEGNRCFVKYIDAGGPPKPGVITLHIEEIND